MGSSQVAAHTDTRTALVRRWRQAAQTRRKTQNFPNPSAGENKNEPAFEDPCMEADSRPTSVCPLGGLPPEARLSSWRLAARSAFFCRPDARKATAGSRSKSPRHALMWCPLTPRPGAPLGRKCTMPPLSAKAGAGRGATTQWRPRYTRHRWRGPKLNIFQFPALHETASVQGAETQLLSC